MDNDLLINREKGVLSLTLNRPTKKNALNGNISRGILNELLKAKNDNSIKVIYITGGTGDFFSSGNDFNNFLEQNPEELANSAKNLILTIANYPKVIVAGVNGGAIGFGLTLLLLVDFVLISDNSFFMVPFIQTNQSPEGGSTFTFPNFFGKSLSSHLLMNGGTISADDAKRTGLASHLFEKETHSKEAYNYALKLAEYPLNLLMKFKQIIIRNFNEDINKAVEYEMSEIQKLWEDPKFKDIISKMIKPKSKPSPKAKF